MVLAHWFGIGGECGCSGEGFDVLASFDQVPGVVIESGVVVVGRFPLWDGLRVTVVVG